MAKTLLEFSESLNYNKQLSKYAKNLTQTYDRSNIDKHNTTMVQLSKKVVLMTNVVNHTKDVNKPEFIENVSHKLNTISEALDAHLKSRIFTEHLLKDNISEPMIDLSPVQPEKTPYYSSNTLPPMQININPIIEKEEEEEEEDHNRPLILPARPKTEPTVKE